MAAKTPHGRKKAVGGQQLVPCFLDVRGDLGLLDGEEGEDLREIRLLG
jgi:hypothetical protein